MCRHFTDNATNPCADERAEPPVHKEGANFCDYFRPASNSYRAGRRERRERAQANLSALFSNRETDAARHAAAEGAPDVESEAARTARRKLDDLFR